MGKLIRDLFNDILNLYKNFLHFNLSKIIIFLVSLLHVIIWTLPFIVIIGAIYYYVLSTQNTSIIDNYYFSGFVILGFIVMIISFIYYFVLQTNLNLSYIGGKKLGYSKNFNFNFKLFRNYFKVMILEAVILVVPFVIYKILIFLLISFVGGESQAAILFNSETINYFKLFVVISGIITLLLFIYLSYKTLFSTVILVDESKGQKFENASYYILKSFKLTKGFFKGFKFLIISILVFIIILPITVPLNYISFNNDNLSNYIEYKTNPESSIKFNNYYILDLEENFGDKDLKELSNKLDMNEKYELFFEILNFLFIFGLFEMMIVSFYVRELKNKSKKIESLNNKKASSKEKLTKTTKAKTTKTKKVEKKSTKTSTDKVSIKKTTAKKTVAKKAPDKKTTKKVEKKESVKRGRGRPKKTDK